MAVNKYKMYMEVFGGMDGVMRVVNILRRGKVRYISMNTEFDGGGRARITIYLEGESKEVRWVAAKLDRLPETYRVRVEPPEEEVREEASTATIQG